MARICIVEDEVSISELLEINLNLEGHETEVCANGKIALDVIKAKKFDLILLDVMLPKKNGIEVLAGMKKNPETVNIAVIMLTNLGGPPETVARALDLGASSYLVKANYTPEQVIGEVKKTLAGGKAKPAAPGTGQNHRNGKLVGIPVSRWELRIGHGYDESLLDDRRWPTRD